MIGTRRSCDLVAERYVDELGDELRGKPLDRAFLEVFAELTDVGVVADIGCREPHRDSEHPSRRSYPLVQRV
ncbi:hypothetical protein ACQPXH_27600 [Nocardia sp. CA-135953]|uniref:hypothetical protein n=1 Tax=Nocardia sp. CA-135953 TaxID=3239978 RepID=UPI003D988E66